MCPKNIDKQSGGEHANRALMEAVRQKEALYRLTDQLYHAQSLDDVYGSALEAILGGLVCDRASVLLFDDKGVMRFVASKRLSKGYRKAVEGHSPWAPDEKNPTPIAVTDFHTAEIDPALKKTIEKEGIRAATFIPLIADGSLIGKFMSYFDSPHTFSDNEIELSVTIARQLAFAIQRRKADDALRASERRFREMIDALPAAIYTTDAEGRLTHFNPAAAEFSGHVPELGTDRWCVSWKLYKPDGTPLPHSECPMALSLKEGRAIRGAEAIALRPDGTRRWFAPYPTPMFDERGKVVGGINMLVDITDRKRSEEALAQQRRLYEAILTNTPDLAYIFDLDHRFIYANESLLKMWGKSWEEAAGKNCLELGYEPWHAEMHDREIEQVIATKQPVHGEAPFTGTSGRRIYDYLFVPVIGEHGEVEAVAGTTRDVTERRQAEEAVRQSEARYRGLLSLMPAGIYMCEAPTGVITFYNERAAQLWGREPRLGDTDERFCGSFRLWLPDGSPLPHHETPMAAAMQEGRSFRGQEVIIERPDGSRISALVNIDPLYDADGTINGVINVFVDVTALKETENELRRKTYQLSAFLETAAIGLHRVGPDGTILWANEAELDMLGYSADEYLGRHFAEFHADPDLARDLLGRLCNGETVRDYKAPMRCKDGSVKTVLIDSSVLWEDGRFLHTQCFTRDITAEERAEELRAAMEAERREAEQRKDVFLAMLAHELRNPLAPISNAIHILRRAKDVNPVQREAHAVIARQAAQLGRLVDDLLEVSRITTGRIQLRREWVMISGLVESAVESVGSLMQQQSHKLVVSVPDDPIWLYADAARIEQVLVNVLNNAAKYTSKGGRIELTVESDRESAFVTVRDNGVGIEPQLLPRVFELFTQAEDSLDRSYGGLGVGLSLVKNLVELHGGDVKADSELGRGSEFTIRLPMSRPPRVKQTTPKVEAGCDESLRVLVVDDNVDAAETIATLLQSYGHTARTAYDGLAALEAANEYLPDVVLLDIGLPKANGYEVAKKIRRDAELENVVLIAMTGYGQAQDRKLSQDAGFDAHLVKPVDFAKIERTIVELAGKRAGSERIDSGLYS